MHTANVTCHVPVAFHQPILDHYHLVAPLLETLFGGAPLVYAAYPRGLGNYATFHGALHSVAPGHLPTIDVAGPRGQRTYVAFTTRALSWALAHTSAVEFHGWGCTREDPIRPRFGRILLELDRKRSESLLAAAREIRARLARVHLQAIPVSQGILGIALWIPLAGGVTYDGLRAWLHELCDAAAHDDPALFSVEPNTIASGRVHLHVGSNAPGRYSVLPYSLRGDVDLHVAVPLTWDELATGTDITAGNFPARLASFGDIFTAQLDAIGDQRLPAPAARRKRTPADVRKAPR